MGIERNRAKAYARVRNWQKANPARAKELQRQYQWRKAGIPFPTRPMPSVCEICGKPPTGKDTVLCNDHDHLTGMFRGWLCRRCNRALGLFEDSSDLLVRAARYLRQEEL